MNRNTIRGLVTKQSINIFSHKRRRQKLRELNRGKFRSAIIKVKKACRFINSKFGEIGRMAVAADRFTINELIGLGPDESTIRFRCQQRINRLEFNKEMNDESYYKECGLY